MKNSILKSICFLALLFFVINKVSAQKMNQKAVIKTTLNCNHCKECETCELEFKTEMLNIKGIKMYELDDKKMTFTVYYNSKKTDFQTIKIAISKLEYDTDEEKTDPKAYENLDGFCKV